MRTSPATVLVIEKHPLMRAAIVNAIADEPDLTIGAIASHGADTIQIVKTLRPDLILFALGNPGNDDIQMLKTLHKISSASAILALTSNEVPGQEQAALKNGAQAVVPKSAQRAELLKALRDLQAKSIRPANRIVTSERSEREEE